MRKGRGGFLPFAQDECLRVGLSRLAPRLGVLDSAICWYCILPMSGSKVFLPPLSASDLKLPELLLARHDAAVDIGLASPGFPYRLAALAAAREAVANPRIWSPVGFYVWVVRRACSAEHREHGIGCRSISCASEDWAREKIVSLAGASFGELAANVHHEVEGLIHGLARSWDMPMPTPQPSARSLVCRELAHLIAEQSRP